MNKEEAKKTIDNAMRWGPAKGVADCLRQIVKGADMSAEVAEIDRLEARASTYDAEIDAAADQAAIDTILGGVTRQ